MGRMNTRCDPKDLAVALLLRSACHVRVSAVIADPFGIHAWSWNSSGRDGLGEHAEAAAVRRSNRKRLPRSTIYIAADRRRNGKCVTAKPCEACQRVVDVFAHVVYRGKDGIWYEM